MFRFWPNHYQWSFQLVRGMATAPWGGAEVGECLAAAGRMRVGDYDSWHEEWLRAGQRTEALAEQARDGGLPVAARDAYARASQYYRLAEFFLEPGDQRKPPAYERLHSAFRAYLGFAPGRPEVVEIPYGDSTLSGFFVPSLRERAEPGPAVIVTGGLESLAEEVYFAAALALAEWGFHALVIDGPGQGETLRWRGLPAVAEFERAVTPAVDYLERRAEVDSERIALAGYSLGGYFVGRAAAFEHRLAALVIWGAQWDYGAVWQTREDDHPLARHLRMILGTATMAEAREKVAAFRLADVIGDIRCPTLVTHGEQDEHVPVDHAYRVHEELRCPKDLKIFTPE